MKTKSVTTFALKCEVCGPGPCAYKRKREICVVPKVQVAHRNATVSEGQEVHNG